MLHPSPCLTGLRPAFFKEKLPPDEHRFLDSVIVFANTNGGTIIVGVSDYGEIVGVEKNLEEIQETITNWISEKCDPRPSFTINQIEIDGKSVIVVDVTSGPSKPYQDLDRGFFVRKAASNRQARRSEVEEMFRIHQVAR
jgi:ATP-dependent DNA helicase RecG